MTLTRELKWPFAGLTLSLFALVAGLVLLVQAKQPLNMDSAWYLVAAKEWLHGGTLYADVALDVNPPMIVWLSAAIVQVARAFDLAEPTVLRCFTVALYCGTAALSWRLLALRKIDEVVQAVALASFAAFGMTVSQEDFGQRDHYVAALLFPYVVAVGVGRPGRGLLRAVVGLALALALCLKPHHVLVPILVNAVVFLFHRSEFRWVSLEEAVGAGGVILYVLLVLLTAPGYLGLVVPLASEVYGAYGISAWSTVAATLNVLLYALLALILTWLATRSGRTVDNGLLEILCAAGVGAWFAFVVQRTAWPYQSAPARMLLRICIPCALVVLARAHWRVAARALGTGIALVCAAYGMMRLLRVYEGTEGRWAPTIQLQAILSSSSRSAPVIAVLTTGLHTGFPVTLYSGARWALRNPCQWMLPAILSGSARDVAGRWHVPPALQAAERFLRESTLADFKLRRPNYVLVDRRFPQQALREQVDLVAYFTQDSAFRDFWDQYRSCGKTLDTEVFCLKRYSSQN